MRIIKQSGTRLTEFDRLAGQIRIAHNAVEAHARDSLTRAVEAGHALFRAKEKMAHGRFMPWVESQCLISHATANLYMRLAKGSELIRKQPNSELIANLGLAGVDRWIRSQVRPERSSEQRRAEEIEKQYRSVALSIDGFLAPMTRVHQSFLGVIPRLEQDELEDVRGLLVDLRQRVETSLSQINRYVRIRADEWRSDLEADGIFDGFNTAPETEAVLTYDR